MSIIRTGTIVAMLCAGLCARAQETPRQTERELVELLKSAPDLEQKMEACRGLALVGVSESVPALAALLSDERLSHVARHALEQIGGPSASEALRAALATLKGLPLAGAIDSLGVLRDTGAIGALGGLLKHGDAAVAGAAARALGAIGTDDASRALQGALTDGGAPGQMEICEGLFRCAERLIARKENARAIELYDAVRARSGAPAHVRIAATRGAILTRRDEGLPLLRETLRGDDPAIVQGAARIALETRDPEVVPLLIGELEKAAPDRQVLLVAILGRRGDLAALPPLLDLARSGAKGVRVPAIRAAIELRDAGAVPVLMGLLKDPDPAVAEAAGIGLAGLRGAPVDAALARALEGSDQVSKVLEIVADRRMTTAMPAIARLMDAPDEAVRLAAIRSYGQLAGASEFAALLQRLERSPSAPERDALEKALASVCGSAADQDACVAKLVDALARPAPATRLGVIRTLRAVGGPGALRALRVAAGDADKEVHAAALRAINEWKTADAAPVLLDLARGAGESVDAILALRGALGMAMRRDVALEEQVAICRGAAPLIRRQEEKQMLLGAIGATADPRLFELILPYLEDPAVKKEAAMAILGVSARRIREGRHDPEIRSALEKVAGDPTADPATARRARALIGQLPATGR